MSDQEIRGRVRSFIIESFYLTDPTQFSDDASLIDSSIIDSTGMMDVILFLEGEFDIRITDREATPENLDSVARIAAFVTRKLGVPAGATQ